MPNYRMNRTALTILTVTALCSCQTKQADIPLAGTWELVSATTIEKDSSFSTFDPTHKMIKILNATHFAFLNHAVNVPADSSHAFTAGGGTYTLTDSTYTENLAYFSDKKWENNAFKFTVRIVGDTLIQKGVEKIEKLGIDHVIIEKYKRVGN
ncbi:hypothetical protein [Spirosoma sordidisoli]|nr:hypothetical protein [Spirosoma sordidisoli]